MNNIFMVVALDNRAYIVADGILIYYATTSNRINEMRVTVSDTIYTI